MKIHKIEAFHLHVPVRSGQSSPWIGETGRQIFVRAEGAGGLVGWGACFAYGVPGAVCQVVEEIAPLAIDGPDSSIEAVVSHMERRTANWSRKGVARFALAGIELALWDLKGKESDLPVCALLAGDGPVRETIPVYYSLPRFETPDEVAAACDEALRDGYSAVKLHQVDIPSVEAARDALGPDADLMLDVNAPWSLEEAIAMAGRLERFDLRWLEEPVWPPEDYRAMAALRSATGIRIACGENDATSHAFCDAIAAGAADVLQPSLLKVGGLIEMSRIAEVISGSEAELAPHSYYHGPGFMASLHFAAATPSVTCLEIPYGVPETPIMTLEPERNGANLGVPTRPGLGADPGPEILKLLSS